MNLAAAVAERDVSGLERRIVVRRMRALLIRLSDAVDELFDLATAAAHTDSMGKN